MQLSTCTDSGTISCSSWLPQTLSALKLFKYFIFSFAAIVHSVRFNISIVELRIVLS